MTRNPEWSAGRGAGLAFALALVATVLMAAPVVLRPSERIFGSGEILSPEDPNRDALVVIDQFRTGRVPPPYLQPLTDLTGQALTRFIGPVAAYNLIVLLSFPFAAAAAYLLGRYVLDSHAGAMVAGFAYAFLPFHVLQAGGHPHIAQTQWLPLYLLALWRCVDRPGPRRAGLLLLAAAAAALADFYGGFIVAVLSPVALVAQGLASPRSLEGRGRRMSVTALVLIAAATAGLGAVRYFVPTIVTNPGSTAFSRSELFGWSARWWSYLIPPADHPIWGASVRQFWSSRGVGLALLEHQQVSLSLSLVALSIVALWGWLREDRESLSARSTPILLVLAAAALLCSLSPERVIGPFTFVRPSALLYQVAPMFRAYARFGGVVGLMTSLLAGGGVALLVALARGTVDRRDAPRSRCPRVRALSALAFARPAPHREPSLDPLAERVPMRVLDCVRPMRVSDTMAAPLVGRDVSLLGAPGLDDCGEPRLGEKLRALGYTHVIVRRDTPEGAWLAENSGRFLAHGSLAPVIGFERSSVLAVSAEHPGAYLSAWLGFHPREYERGRTWRWMANVATLRFAVGRDHEDAILDVEMKSFPAGSSGGMVRQRSQAWRAGGHE